MDYKQANIMLDILYNVVYLFMDFWKLSQIYSQDTKSYCFFAAFFHNLIFYSAWS